MKMLIALAMAVIFGMGNELSSVRQQYIDAATSQNSANTFHAGLKELKANGSNHTLMAYKAASIVLLAKYESGLISKTRLFNRGTDLLEETIEKAPNNYEARLIRLNIQDNVPWITGYTSELKTDKAFLIKNYAKQEAALKDFAKKYAQQSEAFSQKEKAMFD
ncbi:hypothetical protein [uncultured Flavobacterium sp.]|uniref:hypothetical protein n=1 Tax=uncultured Flavobacterium sp. TaxID=165435 RepID=UPI0025DD73F4|nr:hypothetical protein [uncultured Flavobacterium sp.]